MNTMIQQMSVNNAPRDLDGLQKIGKYQLRRIAQELGKMNDQANVQAFMQLQLPNMAEAVCSWLKEYDATNGGAPAPQKMVAPPPVVEAPVVPPPVLAPPAAFGGPPPLPSGRTPATGVSAPPSGGPGIPEITALIVAVQETKASQVALAKQMEGLMTSLGKILEVLPRMQGNLNSLDNLSHVGLSLNLMLAEQHLQDARPAILEAACAEAKSLTTLLSGK